MDARLVVGLLKSPRAEVRFTEEHAFLAARFDPHRRRHLQHLALCGGAITDGRPYRANNPRVQVGSS